MDVRGLLQKASGFSGAITLRAIDSAIIERSLCKTMLECRGRRV